MAEVAQERPVEWSHNGRLRLVDFGEKRPQVLFHLVTGEAAPIDAFRARLEIEDGVGYLEPIVHSSEAEVDEQSFWANDILEFGIHGPPDETVSESFIFSKLRKLETNLAEYSLGFFMRPLVHSTSDGFLVAELYWFRRPVTTMYLKKFWVLPRVQDFIYGVASSSRWACKNIDKLAGVRRSL